jgi:hypothetical protein
MFRFSGVTSEAAEAFPSPFIRATRVSFQTLKIEFVVFGLTFGVLEGLWNCVLFAGTKSMRREACLFDMWLFRARLALELWGVEFLCRDVVVGGRVVGWLGLVELEGLWKCVLLQKCSWRRVLMHG